jgi:hypothetical protein
MSVNVLRTPVVTARPRTPRGLLARVRARRDADAWLRVSDGRREDHPAFAWRAAELTARRERRILARSLRGIAAEATAPRAMPSASPLDRRGVAPHAAGISELADRVGDCDRPVSAAGILLVRDLLTNGTGPLYTGGHVADLPNALARIRSTLEVR